MRELCPVVIYDISDGKSEAPPGNLLAFRGWLDGLVKQIPEEFLPSARIEMDAYSAYKSGVLLLTVSYLRSATVEDVQDRIKRLLEDETAEEEEDRQKYEALKKRFG